MKTSDQLAEPWTDEYVRDLITQGGADLVAAAHNATLGAQSADTKRE